MLIERLRKKKKLSKMRINKKNKKKKTFIPPSVPSFYPTYPFIQVYMCSSKTTQTNYTFFINIYFVIYI